MSRRVRLSVERLLGSAARIAGVPAASIDTFGTFLVGEATETFDPRAASHLNGDGCPLQLSLSCTPESARLRVIGDPCTGTSDRARQRRRAVAALDRVLGRQAPGLVATARRTLDIAVPGPGSRSADAGEVGLEDFSGGIVWVAAPLRGPGAACYVDVRPHGERAFGVAATWLRSLLPDSTGAEAVLEGLRSAGELASIGLEGSSPDDARLKLYLRLRDPSSPLAALRVPLLASEPVRSFLAEVLGPHDVHREGLLLGVGFRATSGELLDAKADVCGHCLPYTGEEWSTLARRVTRRFGLADPHLEDALAGGDCRVAFAGLGVEASGTTRFNLYLESDPAGGRLTPARLRASLADGIWGLCALQRPDGSWCDYDLPVGPSDQWVTAYCGHALAVVAAATGDKQAADAARRASGALAHRTYPAGWGYNATTGADSDSTALALRLQALTGAPTADADREFLAGHWCEGGGFATYRRPGGWGVAHPDVTPLAYMALPPEAQAERRAHLDGFLRRTRGPDGMWPSHWWQQPYYATYQVLKLVAQLGGPALPPPAEPARITPRNAFDVACTVGIETLREGGSAMPGALLSTLLGLQRLDGRWPGAPNLRVTGEDVTTGAPGAAGRCYTDLDGTITTATAVEVLARVVAAEAHGHGRTARPEEREGGDRAALVP